MTKRSSSSAAWLRPTLGVERALQAAQEQARRDGVGLMRPEQLLLALVEDAGSFSTRLLRRLDISPAKIRSEIAPGRPQPPQPFSPPVGPAPTAEAWAQNRAEMLTAGRAEATRLGDSYLGTEHLLLALLHQEGIGGQTLRNLGVTWERVTAALSGLREMPTPMDPVPPSATALHSEPQNLMPSASPGVPHE